jgi:hypothetical protein
VELNRNSSEGNKKFIQNFDLMKHGKNQYVLMGDNVKSSGNMF